MSFDPAMRVGSYDFGSPFTQAFDNTGGSGGTLVKYVGRSYPGASKASAVWQIYLVTYDGNDQVTDIQWAGGNTDFRNVWNNRSSLSYS